MTFRTAEGICRTPIFKLTLAVKDDLKYRFLKGLAETLDIARTMKDFPEAKSQDIRSLFLEFADTFKNRESVNI